MVHRVVVTGLGIIGGHGDNKTAFFNALLAGENRIGPINPETHFDSSTNRQTAGKPVCAVPHDHATLAKMASVEKPQRHDRHQLFALIAADEAMTQAGFPTMAAIPDRERFGAIGGTGDGGLQAAFRANMDAENDKKLDPFTNVRELPNVFNGYVAQRFGLKGPNLVHCTACAASLHALNQATDKLMLGRMDAMLVTGAEAAITKYAIASFAAQRALGSDSLPFSTAHNGFVMGEGAAALVLETYEHAMARGVTILAEVKGYGETGDGNPEAQIVDPDPDGGYRAVREALAMAGLRAGDVDYVNTHGTATPMGDASEIEGIRRWAGNQGERILASSTKSYTGHWLGAAGALETVLSIMMLQQGVVIPTRGLTPDTLAPECTGVRHAMGKPVKADLQIAVSNSFGFGGTNGSVVLKKVA